MINDVVAIAHQAGEAILDIYHRYVELEVTEKANHTPLTQADLLSHQIITQGLQELTPNIPVLSEEAEIPYEIRQHWDRFWLVDPLDGTKEFIRKMDQFTVNIALVEAGVPVLGVLLAPAMGQCYWAQAGKGAFKDNCPIFNRNTHEPVVAAVSHLHADVKTSEFLRRYQIETVRPLGSALKFALLASGEVDVYPRFSPCMEWDTAAGHILVVEAGGTVSIACRNEPLHYNKPDLTSPPFIAARCGLVFN